jgi:hypothetical protein
MSQTWSPAAGQPSGLARTGRLLEVARSTVDAQPARRLQPRPLQRRGPKPAWADAELLEHIRLVWTHAPFVGEG